MKHREDLNTSRKYAIKYAVREPPDCRPSDILQHHAMEFGMGGDPIDDPLHFRDQPSAQACLPGI